MAYKILLADDSVTVQKIITLTFSDEGADVLAVNNGDEAIHRLQYLRPALVMADVSIPGKNGYEICEFVKNHPEMKDTPVVLLVPAFEPFDEERARRIGADQHLTKPFQSIRTLIQTVKNLIETHPQKFTTGSIKATDSLAQAAPQPEAPAAIIEPEPELEIEPVNAEPAAVEHQITVGNVPSTQPFPYESPQELSQTEEVQFNQGYEILSDTFVDVQEIKMPDTLIDFEPEPENMMEAEAELITDAVMQPNVKVLGEEEMVSQTNEVKEPMAPPLPIQDELNADVDHVLDLDDVLTWPPAPMPEPPIQAPEVIVPMAPSFTPAPAETTIPQSVIDEIVNRVVDQLSEKLTAKLAAQLAPEIAELIKKQTLHEPPSVPTQVPPDSDSLLDLD